MNDLEMHFYLRSDHVGAHIVQGIYPEELHKNSDDRVNTDKANLYYIEFPPQIYSR